MRKSLVMRPPDPEPGQAVIVPAEQLKRHQRDQPPVLRWGEKCLKCGDGPLLVMPHDNATPNAILACCAQCGALHAYEPEKPEAGG